MAGEPPVLPDREEARRWAEEELAKPEYRDASPGWLENLWQSILEWLRSLDRGPSPDTAAAGPWIGVAIAVLIAAAIILARPRLNARAKGTRDVFDADPTVSAAGYRQRAAAAASAGDWTAAVVDCFRALVRTAEDRNVLDARPGQTADEVAYELSRFFSTEARRLADAARTFDGLRYGNEPASEASYAAMLELDSALNSLKPDSAPLSAEPDGITVPR